MQRNKSGHPLIKEIDCVGCLCSFRILSTLQEKGHFSFTLAPLFVKDLGNLQFSNSGVKVERMWGYASGAKLFGAKVVFVKILIMVLSK